MSVSNGKKINWHEYNKALKNRGSITLWVDKKCLKSWRYAPKTKKRGRPFKYHDSLIEMLLVVRSFYNLPLRALEGFSKDIPKILKTDFLTPDYTVISRRAKYLPKIKLLNIERSHCRKGIDVLVDSTGLKIKGVGEWCYRKFKGSYKRRTWIKVHLAIDANTHEILALDTSGHLEQDHTAFKKLLDQVKGNIKAVYADGAYDRRAVFKVINERGSKPFIPVVKGARLQNEMREKREKIKNGSFMHLRDDLIINARKLGFKKDGVNAWKKASGYHRRSLVETAMSRLKGMISRRLRSKNPLAIKTEVAAMCKTLNIMTNLGIPKYVPT